MMVDIDKMEAGPELNALVAEEAMGYVWKKGTIVGNHQGAGQEGEGWGLDQFNWVNPLVQPYSTDWRATGEVMEKFEAEGWWPAVYKDENGWHAIMDHPSEEYTPIAMASTPQLAICRAALKTVELLEKG